jgi:hypothetical protein
MWRTKYTLELLAPIVKESMSYREVCRRLGVNDSNNGTRSYITKVIAMLGIDTSHFSPNGRRPKTRKRRISDEQFLVKNSTYNGGGGAEGKSRLRLTLEKYKPVVCDICNNPGVWLDQPLKLQVDHIDGDRMNNQLDNLRWLCPNCHQQTTTWGKKKGSG